MPFPSALWQHNLVVCSTRGFPTGGREDTDMSAALLLLSRQSKKVFWDLLVFVLNSAKAQTLLWHRVWVTCRYGLRNLLRRCGIWLCSLSVRALFFLPLTVMLAGWYFDFSPGRRTWALSEQCFFFYYQKKSPMFTYCLFMVRKD